MKSTKLLCVMALFPLLLNAQSVTKTNTSIKEKLIQGDNYRNGVLVPVNYQKAFDLYMECALAGSAKAMNDLGLMYLNGLGVSKDGVLAAQWFEKAGNAGYATGWFNLAQLYKYPVGIPQDFNAAFVNYQKAANAGYNEALYNIGYCYYKGFGVKQSYTKALESLTKGVAKNSYSSMYFLGLCYRNGYGTPVDTAKAHALFVKSAARNYALARAELQSPLPENSYQIDKKNASVVKLYKTFNNVHNNIAQNQYTLDGKWEGKLITYDWGGTSIIGIDTVAVSFTTNGKQLTGHWTEPTTSFNLTGLITDTAVLYTNTVFEKASHYIKHLTWEMQSGNFEASTRWGKTYLTGSIALYTPDLLEPGHPQLVILEKVADPAKKTTLDSIVNVAATDTSWTLKSAKVADVPSDLPVNSASASVLSLYPNPFTTSFTIQYRSQTGGEATVSVFDLNGQLVYTLPIGTALAGVNTYLFDKPLNLTGSYVLKVKCGSETLSTIAIKQ